MSIWWRQPAREQRSQQFAPVPPLAYPSMSFSEVDLTGAEASLQVVAVHAATDLIASLGSELPIDVYRGQGSAREKLPTPPWLLDPGGDGQGLEDWSYQALMSWLLRGNLYGDLLDERATYWTQVQLHHPDRVTGWLDDDGQPVWVVNGRRVDKPARFIHRRVNPMPGTVVGLSPIALHMTNIGLSVAAARFGRQWFSDGAHPSALFKNEIEEINDESRARTIKDRFMAAMYGSREPMVVGKGWSYEALTVNPEESQFLQTNGYSAAECARIYGPGVAEVLGYESGGSLTYTNVESRSAHLLVYSVNKWFTRLERLLSRFLPRPQYVRINRAAMLQSTTLERYRAHEILLRNKVEVVNEARDDLDLPPVPWGDEPNAPGGAASEPQDDEPTGAEVPKAEEQK